MNKLTAHQKKAMQQEIQARYGWTPDAYKLEFRAEWDHAKIPIVVAIPTKLKVDFSPTFAILPDGKLLTPHDEGALERILRTAFAQPQVEDANAIAEVALIFGDFGDAVGHLWLNPVEGRVPPGLLQRTDPHPTLHWDGSACIVEFYAYNYELLILSDCAVEIMPDKLKLRSRRLQKK